MGKLHVCALSICEGLGDKRLLYPNREQAEAFMALAKEHPIMANVPMLTEVVGDMVKVVIKEEPDAITGRLSEYQVDAGGILHSTRRSYV